MKCPKTNLSPSYAYKQGCRCEVCKANKAVYTKKEAPKNRERVKLWHLQHPDRIKAFQKKARDTRWLNTRGTLLVSQEGKCAICGRTGEEPAMRYGGRLVLDHNHTTNEIRGLLCGSCNIGLGHFKDSPELLQKAKEYLDAIA